MLRIGIRGTVRELPPGSLGNSLDPRQLIEVVDVDHRATGQCALDRCIGLATASIVISNGKGRVMNRSVSVGIGR